MEIKLKVNQFLKKLRNRQIELSARTKWCHRWWFGMKGAKDGLRFIDGNEERFVSISSKYNFFLEK